MYKQILLALLKKCIKFNKFFLDAFYLNNV